MVRKAVLATLVLPLVASIALAGMPMNDTMKCPIGGKTFEYETTAAYSTYGQRPDGKPYGSWKLPLELPECPDNGLVVYAEFTRAQIKALKPLVASETYQTLRDTDTPRYRAMWLMRELGAPADDVLWMLLSASWEADDNPGLKARYQRELVEQAAKFPKPTHGEDLHWIALQARVVNALRELGRTDEAIALLQTLPRQSLDVPVPARREVENLAEIDAAENRRHWLALLVKMEDLIRRGDTSSEPIDMIPANVAAHRCMEDPDFSKPEVVAVCESEEIRKLIAEIRQSTQDIDE